MEADHEAQTDRCQKKPAEPTEKKTRDKHVQIESTVNHPENSL